MKAIAIILAAGESRRMGEPKALLEVAPGVSFLARLVQTFTEAQLTPLVVLGADADKIQAAHPEVPAVLNAHWAKGQFSSVLVGLRAALSQGAERVLIHPVDAPLISAQTATSVLRALSGAQAIIPSHLGKAGHPLGLQASAARAVLTSPANTLEEAAGLLAPSCIDVKDPSILDNLNSPEAFRARLGRT